MKPVGFDWACQEQHGEIFRFARGMNAFRRAHPALSEEQFYTDAEIHWFSPQGGTANWDPNGKELACMVQESEQGALYLIFNAGANRSDFRLPEAPSGFRWHLAIDTFLAPPRDIFAAGEEALLDDAKSYRVEAGSTAILVARRRATGGASK